ncbi:MAG: SufE family protein [Chthoniobacteraceae bacterium]
MIAARSMTPSQRQSELIARYSILPDAHERLAALSTRRSRVAPVPAEERTDEKRVPGCVSKVWMDAWMENGRCHLRMHAESPLVGALASVLCEIYDAATPEEIEATEPAIFQELGIEANLSPTRLNGLANLRARIVAFAREADRQ